MYNKLKFNNKTNQFLKEQGIGMKDTLFYRKKYRKKIETRNAQAHSHQGNRNKSRWEVSPRSVRWVLTKNQQPLSASEIIEKVVSQCNIFRKGN